MSFRNYIIEKTVVIYDNNGETFDRYTVIIDNKDVFGMSENPGSAQGFNQWAGNVGKDIRIGSHLGKTIKITSVPKEVQKAIKDRMKE